MEEIYTYIYIYGFSTKICSGSWPKFTEFPVRWDDAARGGCERTVLAFGHQLVINGHTLIFFENYPRKKILQV